MKLIDDLRAAAKNTEDDVVDCRFRPPKEYKVVNCVPQDVVLALCDAAEAAQEMDRVNRTEGCLNNDTSTVLVAHQRLHDSVVRLRELGGEK